VASSYRCQTPTGPLFLKTDIGSLRGQPRGFLLSESRVRLFLGSFQKQKRRPEGGVLISQDNQIT
jgi:hypothetical protein